jgi:rubredoxin
MDFLLQLDFHNPVNLSSRFKFAYIFFCNGYIDEPNGVQCPSWEQQAGSNCVLLLSSPDPSSCIDGRGVVRYDDFSLAMQIRHEPVVDSEDFSLPDDVFLDKTGKEDIRDNTSCTIKLGGTPVFLQTPEEVECPECGGRVTFLAQIGSELENPGWGGYSFNTSGGEFFVFKCAKECSPRGAVMYLQIT